MDFVQLNYFISVAKHRNFSAASREFFVSQPCISHRIKELEKELNTPLFVRNTRTVELTTAGEIFLEDAKRMVSILEKSKEKLLQSETTMHLNIMHLASPTRNFLPQIVNIFKHTYPHIKVHLHRADALNISEAAARHTYDLYFSMRRDLASISHLSTKIIQTDHYCLVTPPDHPAIVHMAIDYDKLASEPFLVFQPSHAKVMHQQILEICSQLGFSPRITETFDLYEDLLYAIESGIGISILPYRTKNYSVTALSYTLLDISDVSIDLSLGWEQDITNPAVPLFLDVFWNFMKEHPEVFL